MSAGSPPAGRNCLPICDRKLRERGWDGDGEPPLEDLADRMVRLGYVDDRAYALSKARSLTGRGYGERRVRQALVIAGIDEEQRSRCPRAGRGGSGCRRAAIRQAAVDRTLSQPASPIRGERERAIGGDDPRRPSIRAGPGNYRS